MTTDKTKRLEYIQGETVKVTYNIADDIRKFTAVITGKLYVYRTHYSVIATGTPQESYNWCNFTDDNIARFDGELPYWIELKG